MHLSKRATEPCPNCGAFPTAEYVLIGGDARWSCHCGAGGALTGDLAIRSKAGDAPAAPVKQPHRHWTDAGSRLQEGSHAAESRRAPRQFQQPIPRGAATP